MRFIDQENADLLERKTQMDLEFSNLRIQMEEIQKVFDEFYVKVDDENCQREDFGKKLKEEIVGQNEEIEKYQLEKKKIIEEYEAKLNLKNIRYELEMDDFLRNKNGNYFGTEIKPKTITKSKYTDFKVMNEDCHSKKNLKFV